MASLSTNEERANAVRNGTERTTIYIGSRKSELAMIQTRHVKQLLENTHGDKYTFVIKTTSTLGDEVLDVPLSVIGNKNPGLINRQTKINVNITSGSNSNNPSSPTTSVRRKTYKFKTPIKKRNINLETPFSNETLKIIKKFSNNEIKSTKESLSGKKLFIG